MNRRTFGAKQRNFPLKLQTLKVVKTFLFRLAMNRETINAILGKNAGLDYQCYFRKKCWVS